MVQDVVIALEADLAVGVHIDIIAGLDPEDVVAQLHVLGTAVHEYSITDGLVHRVVDHLGRREVAATDDNPLVAVGVDQVVAHQAAKDDVLQHADRVAVNGVALYRATVLSMNADIAVVIDPVAGSGAAPQVDAIVVVMDDVLLDLGAVVGFDADLTRVRLAIDGVAGHQHVVLGLDATVRVVVNFIASAQR